ncbi:MAG: alkaline phosphatase family protein [Burkholderiales bacterium]|nr:alkaline phosphatase family protein [Phycisphaerae bacterium]
MKILLGPVLRLQSATSTHWNVSVLIATDGDAPVLQMTDKALAAAVPIKLLKASQGVAYRFDLSIPLKQDQQTVAYHVQSSGDYDFLVPGDQEAARMAYVSCNGFSSPADIKSVAENNAGWSHLLRRHSGKDRLAASADPTMTRGESFHILLMGGDQVYADEIWYAIPDLKAWASQGIKARVKAPFTKNTADRVAEFYFGLYCERWSQPEVAAVLARIPTVMMWDDHDIFDGYGSYTAELNKCDSHKGIFNCARTAFRVFQLHLPTDVPNGASFVASNNYSQIYIIGRIGILVLDTRCERTDAQVMAPNSWTEIFTKLGNTAGIDHLIVMASIPIMYPSLAMAETALKYFPGYQDLEDDLRDHWTSPRRRPERLRLIHRLLSWAQEKRTRVTIISGDVHLAALGVIESDRHGAVPTDNVNSINQLVSSPMVHPSPGGMVRFFIDTIGDSTEQIDRDITGHMLTFNASRQRFINRRNWLSLTPDPGATHAASYRLWANWWLEGDDHPMTKVIHPPVKVG